MRSCLSVTLAARGGAIGGGGGGTTGGGSAANEAPATWSPAIAIVHVAAAPAPAQGPAQPAKTEPGRAVAVSVTRRPAPSPCVQSVAQSIPDGSLDTVPRAIWSTTTLRRAVAGGPCPGRSKRSTRLLPRSATSSVAPFGLSARPPGSMTWPAPAPSVAIVSQL